MKKTIYAFILLLFSLNFSFGQNIDNQKIDQYLKEVIEVNEIPGGAVAVIKDGKLIYEKYFGKASLEENKPVDKNTHFKIFSTTKLITVVGVFQLIEKRKLSLEDPISKYLDNLPKEWQEIKVKYLLTHSSGLPDIVQFEDIPFSLPYSEKITLLSKKPMPFATGNEFQYNQTNYLFLAKIIEKISGFTFEEFILQNQFKDVKTKPFFLSDFGKITPTGAVRYNYNSETQKYVKNNFNSGPDSHSANGLNIKLSEFIEWNKNLDNDVYIQKETKTSMWKPFSYVANNNDFTYGWEIRKVNDIISYGFSGGNETSFRKFPSQNLTVIFLSNGHKYSELPVQDQVVFSIAGIVEPSLNNPYYSEREKMTNLFFKEDFDKGFKYYSKLKKQHSDWNFESRLNIIGYILMNNNRLKEAIQVFDLNTKENPNSGNAFDSLADSYFKNNELEISKSNYKKALELSPENKNAKEMLEKIDNLLKEKS